MRILIACILSVGFNSTMLASPLPSAAEAAKWADQRKDASSRLGAIERKRAEGDTAGALRDLTELVLDGGAKNNPELLDLLAWRMLPNLQVNSQPLRDLPGSSRSWQLVYEMSLANGHHDRERLMALVREAPASIPVRFPESIAESAHQELLREFGLSPAAAGLEVLRVRSFEPLYTLRDLDLGLSREAEFQNYSGRAEDAKALVACRDHLREAYLKSSRHLVERLFALRLLGMSNERTTLLDQVKNIPYLQDAKARTAVFNRLDEATAWRLLIQPLLESEIGFAENPPDLTKSPQPAQQELIVEATSKEIKDGSTLYSKNVRAKLGHLSFACDSLTVHAMGTSLVGSGSVRIGGVPGLMKEVIGERFSFSADTGSITLGGDIRIPRTDGTLKLRACTINRSGEVGERRSLLDDFHRNVNTEARLELLPRIATIYDDQELSNEARYWLALHLLSLHLTWHAPVLPPIEKRVEQLEQLQEESKPANRDHPWQAAHRGELWQRNTIPDAVVEQFQRQIQERAPKEQPTTIAAWADRANREAFSWRLKNPDHVDVTRATKLLRMIHEGDHAANASRWVAEIERNNTVITMEVAGGYGPAKDVPIVLDVRNAERLSFKLYRVRKADDLLAVCDRIGNDFIYRDHGLDERGERRILMDRMKVLESVARSRSREDRQAFPPASFLKDGPLHHWNADVGDLQVLADVNDYPDYWGDEDHDDDSAYFDDACWQFQERLRKSYRPKHRELSSWQCDRIARVPGKFLREPGAYVVAIEANGQTAFVPILIDPLSLSLKRSRDGVLVAVHDAEGFTPIKDARITARRIVHDVTTDAEGIAFAKVFAAGDRAIIAENDGRFAIGGFGRVFVGLYKTTHEEQRDRFHHRLQRAARDRIERAASVYEDRYIVAAYTDRPIYRPGQQVQFKVIIRQFANEEEGKPRSNAFRSEDFEVQSRLLIPKGDSPIPYTLLDAKGRAVAEGQLKLNDFGTASGEFTLNAEAATGNYTIRVRLKDQNRLVPNVFAVQYYRRPTFELKITGVPTEPGDFSALKLSFEGGYYFGKPVSGGRVQLELRDPASRRPIDEANTQLDAQGKAKHEWKLPSTLPSGRYLLSATLVDESGRSVSQVREFELRRQDDPKPAPTFASVPRFVPFDKELVLRTMANQVTIEQGRSPEKEKNDPYRKTIFGVKDGQAAIKFPQPGWFTVTAGDEQIDLFAYGGKEHPSITWTRRTSLEPERTGKRTLSNFEWINLSKPNEEEEDNYRRDDRELLALLDRHEARLGDKLTVLVFVPFQKARLLFTVEGHTIRDYHTASFDEASGFYHVIELPIRERHLPHFYLGGHIVAGTSGKHSHEVLREQKLRALEAEKRLEDDDDGEDIRRHRIDVIDTQRNNEKLKVELSTDRSDYKPGDKVNARLRVIDSSGKPADAEISLAAVDESIYFFGEDRAGGLASMFSNPHPSELWRIKAWRSAVGKRWQPNERQRMQQQMDQMKAAQEAAMKHLENARSKDPLESPNHEVPPLIEGIRPASTIPLARMRSDFRETAVWLPHLRTGANGEANADFTLPDTLTRYRLTAVALNKQSDIGSVRTTITSRLRLSAQLVLPRFAVEKDTFTAFGMIHNTTDRDQQVEFQWEVSGLVVGKDGLVGKVAIPAGQSRRVDLPLEAKQAGTARVSLKVSSDTDADAEKRDMLIVPLGREKELYFDGAADGKQAIKLPANFIPQEVRVVVAHDDVAQALTGLGYLIDYPYGCVEQTMSRFLPAVVVREATRKTAIQLPPDAAAKLPQVISQGLARLYRFQHDDGGWGWWEHDPSNDGMTAYVVHGLAICKRGGVTIDEEALQRACSYLSRRFEQKQLSGMVAAKAWLALALANRADLRGLVSSARDAAARPAPDSETVLLALACRRSGLRVEFDMLSRRLKESRPAESEAIAGVLQVRMAAGAPLAECNEMADALLKKRQGERWENTQATAAAILALADYAIYVKAENPARSIVIRVDGKDVAGIRDPEVLKNLVHRVNLQASIFQSGNRDIQILGDADRSMRYSIVAKGIEKLDKLQPIGKEIRFSRKRETLDGKLIDRSIKMGEVIAVRLTVELEKPQEFVIVEDRRPMNCEFADEQVVRKSSGASASAEFRDDRVSLFFTHLPAGKHEFVYYLRAETPGISHLLPGCCYPMYTEQIRGEMGSDRVEVISKEP